MRLAPGTVLRGRYQIVGPIDGSSDAAVYEARHVGQGGPCVVKLLCEGRGASAPPLDELRREAMEASSGAQPGLPGPAGIVRVLDLDETADGSPFLVMERLRGASLASLIGAGALALSDVAIIVEEIAWALEGAHQRGIVHGELTPENVLVLDAPSDTRVKLLDFGVADLRAQAGGLVHSGSAARAAAYLAPERGLARRPDVRGDVYSLGAIAHAMIAVAPPAVAAVVTRAMNRDPEARFASVAELASALRAAVAAPRSSGVTPIPTPVRRTKTQPVPVHAPPAATERVVLVSAGTKKVIGAAVGVGIAIVLAVALIPRGPRARGPAPAPVSVAAPPPRPVAPPAPMPIASAVAPSPSAPLAGLTLPPPALAAPSPAPRRRSAHADMSADAKKEMKASFETASRAFDLRNFEEAIAAYKRTYELGGDAPMLYNIAQALRLSNRPDEAVLYYRRYLARAPRARNRDEVLSRIAELTAKGEPAATATPR